MVSTLTLAEAPDIFDYFADKKISGRTEKDPWGRNLPEWNLSKVWSADLLSACGDDGGITLPCSITRGT